MVFYYVKVFSKGIFFTLTPGPSPTSGRWVIQYISIIYITLLPFMGAEG
jgi:hypothetical protein